MTITEAINATNLLLLRNEDQREPNYHVLAQREVEALARLLAIATAVRQLLIEGSHQ